MPPPKMQGQVKFVPKQRTDFFSVLKERVDAYFAENHIAKQANNTLYVKTVVLVLAYIIPFVMLLTLQPNLIVSLFLWAIMGFAVAGVGMSVMHDANHGAYSTSKTVNDAFGYLINLLGGSTFNWKNQHNVMHHTYTNITHLDEDIDDKLILKFSPHTKVKAVHKYQWLYAFLMYGLTTIYWVTLKDFIQFFAHIRRGVNKQNTQQNTIVFIRLVLLKIAYFGTFLALPMYVGLPTGQVVAGFLLMHYIAGMVLSVIFQLAHTIEETTHPMPNEKGVIENNWAIHQLNTTADFSPKNKVLSWYIGGLNFQVEHHLFPLISHVHYPAIAPIVKATAEEYGVPYLVHYNFWDALDSHISALKRFGSASLDEVID
ncbi:linoleoyl-CoA desaturase [Flexibacter flexilis DSM 6793]|uniref:Linoleoyl-CoA desaturase n=1 Tax=Flexibacter flexilis DSM 6793 TaxID=927664 RepID=A0A1I1H8B1_9BACT|nr:acyl-CoA desaturase [Flexibacter flexilis]SFC20257.1 linoleoyl-CoA desaturase [Flexibacter flexilis DSM 6793]